MKIDPTENIYIGDGVYAQHDGWQIWLMTEREGRIESIALEPAALRKLLAYAKELGMQV